LNDIEQLARSGGAALARLSDYISIALIPKQRIGSIFVERILTCEGDGTSKDRAIVFSKARTPLEAVSMIYRYLEAEGIQIIGPKSIGAIEGGFIFDVFPTARGPIWFKVPMSAT
jgi:hypothetical protein